MSVIKRLSLHEFTLWGRDLVSVVRIRESPYYRRFFFYRKYGTLETVRNLEVSVLVKRGVGTERLDCTINKAF